MNTKNRKIIFGSLVLILTILVNMFSITYAEEVNEKITLELSEEVDSLNAGDEINVKIKMKKEQDSDYEIKAFEADLEYDKSILEIVATDDDGLIDFKSDESWTVSMNKDYNKIIGYGSESSNPEEIATITFKVKDGVNTDKSIIKLNNIEVTNEVEISSNQESVELKVGKKSILDNKNFIMIIAIVVLIILLLLIIIIKKKKSK